MFTIIYFIGYIVTLFMSIYRIKKDAGYITVSYLCLCVFVALTSWFGIVFGLILYITEMLSDLDFWNKKLF